MEEPNDVPRLDSCFWLHNHHHTSKSTGATDATECAASTLVSSYTIIITSPNRQASSHIQIDRRNRRCSLDSCFFLHNHHHKSKSTGIITYPNRQAQLEVQPRLLFLVTQSSS